MKPLSVLAVSAALAAAGAAHAAPGRWTGGFGQGIIEANVENAGVAAFRVNCPAGAEGAVPGMTLEVMGLTGGSNQSASALIAVDGRNTNWTFQRRVLDQNQVIFDFDARTVAEKRSLQSLVAQLRRGRSVTVSIPSQQQRHTFTLAGSGAALADCAGPY